MFRIKSRMAIKNRIALLYSVISILLVILCSIIFLALFKYNVNKKSIIQGVTEHTTVSTVNGENAKGKKDPVYSSIDKNYSDVEFKSDKKPSGKDKVITQDVQVTTKDSDNNQKTISYTGDNFEERIIRNLYKRFFVILAISVTVIIVINFALSKRYASFALDPLNEFTDKVKHQQKSKSIDLIELPKAKDEIYDLTSAYNDAIGKIKESYGNMQRLNSYASHELRNSLAVLKTKVELNDNKDIDNYIDKLNGTITDILAMSTNSLSKYQEDVDLALVCAKVVDEYSIIFKNIEFTMPYDGVDLIKGREIWIERCVVNIIDNAIKFVDKAKNGNKISVNISQDSEYVKVEIYDNGIGIDNGKLEDIFIPYYGTKNRVSTGIGLAYVKHIMNLHQGKVLVESKKGEYTKFTLVFKKNVK